MRLVTLFLGGYLSLSLPFPFIADSHVKAGLPSCSRSSHHVEYPLMGRAYMSHLYCMCMNELLFACCLRSWKQKKTVKPALFIRVPHGAVSVTLIFTTTSLNKGFTIVYKQEVTLTTNHVKAFIEKRSLMWRTFDQDVQSFASQGRL